MLNTYTDTTKRETEQESPRENLDTILSKEAIDNAKKKDRTIVSGLTMVRSFIGNTIFPHERFAQRALLYD